MIGYQYFTKNVSSIIIYIVNRQGHEKSKITCMKHVIKIDSHKKQVILVRPIGD